MSYILPRARSVTTPIICACRALKMLPAALLISTVSAEAEQREADHDLEQREAAPARRASLVILPLRVLVAHHVAQHVVVDVAQHAVAELDAAGQAVDEHAERLARRR